MTLETAKTRMNTGFFGFFVKYWGKLQFIYHTRT